MPRWRGDGKELFYVTPGTDLTMCAVPIELKSKPEIGQTTKLFHFNIPGPSAYLYDVTKDGRRFILNHRTGVAPSPVPLTVVQHFDNELREALDHRD